MSAGSNKASNAFGSLRSHEIQPFQVMAILAQAQALQAQGVDVIHLEIGEPDFPTAEPIIEAGINALKEGKTGYTPALGLPALRESIAQYYQERFNVTVCPERIILAPGASGVLLLLAATRLNPNDGMLLANPGYPCNKHFARLFEAHGQLVNTGPSDNFQLTPAHVHEHWNEQTKVALVASPSNPTGTVLNLNELKDLADAVREKGGELWVDEIYQGLNYGNQPQTVLSVADDVVVLNSFSKFFGMTGWRLGWAVVPESWVPSIDALAQNVFLAPPTPSQYAALAAFSEDSMEIFEKRRQALEERRAYMLQALPELGFNIPIEPEGAFYIYADASRFTDDSFAWCQEVLQETGVAITPGADFGDPTNSHVRFAFTTELSRLREAVARLKAFLD